MDWLTWQDIGTAIFWSIILYFGILAFHYWLMNVKPVEWTDGPDVSSGYSRKNASHLSWVSGGDFGKSDPEAFCAGWEQV